MINYTYTATGQIISQQLVSDGCLGTRLDYAGPFVFYNSTTEPAWENMPHGRFVKNGTTWTKEIHLKDHTSAPLSTGLGNTRMAMLHNGTTYTIAQENFYYPFGMRISTLSSDPGSLWKQQKQVYVQRQRI